MSRWSHHTVDRRAVEVHCTVGSAHLITGRGPFQSADRCAACGQGDGLDRTVAVLETMRETTAGPRSETLGVACWPCVIYIANGECDPDGECCREGVQS